MTVGSTKPARRTVALAFLAILLGAILAITFGGRSEAAFPGDNGRIVFSSNRDDLANYEIYSMNANGNDVVRLTNSPGLDERPVYSPGGKLIAFSRVTGGNRDVWVMNADGSNQRRLTTHPASDFRSAFSPDGETIAFSSTRGGDDEIWTIGVDGSDPVQLTNAAATSVNPDYSPDGTKIAFASNRDGDLEIFTMNADGTNQVPLTNDPGQDSIPSWSPDGTKIIFNSSRSDPAPDADIWIMNADGSVQTQVTTDPAEDAAPVFSPDGTKIVFHSRREAPTHEEIFVMDASGANQVPLTATADPVLNIFPDWQSLEPPPPPPPAPPPAPAPDPPPADTTAPLLTLGGDKRQPADAAVEITASCNETCSVAAAGTLTVRTPDGEKGKRARTVFDLKPASAQLEPAETAVLTLKLKKKARRAALAALEDGGKAKAKLTVTATDPSGNAATAKRGAKLKPPPD